MQDIVQTYSVQHAAHIIGPGGDTIRAIILRSGAYVRAYKRADHTWRMGFVGTQEEVDRVSSNER